MFGKPCAVCAEKDNRISDLKEHIKYFQNMLNPPLVKSHEVSQNYQADMILDGGGKEETSLEDASESPEVLAERSAMLSGTY